MQAQTTPSVFQFQSNKVRVVIKDGEPWFVAKDVCKSLDYKDAFNGTRLLEANDVAPHIVRTKVGDRKVTVINESGLYTLIFRSRKPEALKFTKWVTSEVLPAIRKTGKYCVDNNKDDNCFMKRQEAVIDDMSFIMKIIYLLPEYWQNMTFSKISNGISNEFIDNYKRISCEIIDNKLA